MSQAFKFLLQNPPQYSDYETLLSSRPCIIQNALERTPHARMQYKTIPKVGFPILQIELFLCNNRANDKSYHELYRIWLNTLSLKLKLYFGTAIIDHMYVERFEYVCVTLSASCGLHSLLSRNLVLTWKHIEKYQNVLLLLLSKMLTKY